MTNPNYHLYDKMKREEAQKLAKLQLDYCNSINAPCFIPDTGICLKCNRSLLDEKEASIMVVTSCKHCARSYID